ncbi:MAG TPA: RNA polymerase sigma factor region1.1 domain-containing protein, partial [Thermomicrobiales bacterium]|nr:RNA polymerase sigma factor region1.1 domain-containing protein [Thermomicrobiales bacterium]
MTMAKKHVKPARKSRPATRAKSTARKPAAKSGSRKLATAASRRSPAKRPAAKPSGARRPTSRSAASKAKPAPKAKPVAKTAKPAPAPAAKPDKLDRTTTKLVAAAPAAASKPVPNRKPSVGEIAAKIAGKRAEDAAHRKGKNGKHAEVAPRELTPADVEARKRRLKTLIVLGKERGYLTYAEINDHLPDDILDAEQIEGIISMIGDMGIQVYDEAPDAETLLMSESTPSVPAEDVEEEAEAAASTLDSEFGRTTDPVRMYMREMGSVELLTREGEIEIAKRIEEGLKHMIQAISACPMTVAQILDLADKIAKDELKIDDVVDGLLDFNEQL